MQPRHGVYQPFLDYPFADVVVLLHAVARARFPAEPLLQALRLLGRATVAVFLQSRAGRVVRTMGGGPREALLRLPSIWKATDPQSHVEATEPEPRVVQLDVRGFPSWIDCGVIGTIEQVVINHAVEPELDVELRGPAEATFLVRWS